MSDGFLNIVTSGRRGAQMTLQSPVSFVDIGRFSYMPAGESSSEVSGGIGAEALHGVYKNEFSCLPAICLLTGKFIIPILSNAATIWFLGLFTSIILTSVLELRWSGIGIEDWWRNEQFWVIGGVSAHLFAVFQGILKMVIGLDTNFTVTSKAAEDGDFGELYVFKWTTVLIPPTTILVLNLLGVVAGFSDALNNGYESWGPLFGKVFFA
ncbi:hypothetical protein QYE76_055200 [Lolium multiflorum]|uniref:Cellulose synthase n=1 Tax=Lolium multiflorum TaxID=4521 RepID=A0AAD8T0K9_LOLMU|nr:hypothetical protein QYE76_055200 [Lolium multiflorum]